MLIHAIKQQRIWRIASPAEGARMLMYAQWPKDWSYASGEVFQKRIVRQQWTIDRSDWCELLKPDT